MTVWAAAEDNPALGLFGPVVAELGLTGVVPPGPDSARFADQAEVRRLLADWDDVAVDRAEWTVTVEPGAWFDAVADATPRTGAVLSQASPESRAAARARYVEVATRAYAAADGRVELPAAAVVIGATAG